MAIFSRHAVDAQFNDAASSIVLFGLSDDVVSVEKLVQSQYAEAVSYVTLDLHLPGMAVVIVTRN